MSFRLPDWPLSTLYSLRRSSDAGIGCCLLYKRHHPILSFQGHSILIRTSFDGNKQCFISNERRMAEWLRNEPDEVWMEESDDVSYIRDITRFFHLKVIPDWRSDDPYFWWCIFSRPPNLTSFLPIPSFSRHFGFREMTKNENHNGRSIIPLSFFHFHNIPTTNVVQEWCQNDGLRWNEEVFLIKGETLE